VKINKEKLIKTCSFLDISKDMIERFRLVIENKRLYIEELSKQRTIVICVACDGIKVKNQIFNIGDLGKFMEVLRLIKEDTVDIKADNNINVVKSGNITAEIVSYDPIEEELDSLNKMIERGESDGIDYTTKLFDEADVVVKFNVGDVNFKKLVSIAGSELVQFDIVGNEIKIGVGEERKSESYDGKITVELKNEDVKFLNKEMEENGISFKVLDIRPFYSFDGEVVLEIKKDFPLIVTSKLPDLGISVLYLISLYEEEEE